MESTEDDKERDQNDKDTLQAVGGAAPDKEEVNAELKKSAEAAAAAELVSEDVTQPAEEQEGEKTLEGKQNFDSLDLDPDDIIESDTEVEKAATPVKQVSGFRQHNSPQIYYPCICFAIIGLPSGFTPSNEEISITSLPLFQDDPWEHIVSAVTSSHKLKALRQRLTGHRTETPLVNKIIEFVMYEHPIDIDKLRRSLHYQVSPYIQ